jgi:hypothetical protein
MGNAYPDCQKVMWWTHSKTYQTSLQEEEEGGVDQEEDVDTGKQEFADQEE